MISIIMNCYNGEAFLKKALESVLRQNYQNWELIIVDDCSTDNSVEIAKGYEVKDRRIKLIE